MSCYLLCHSHVDEEQPSAAAPAVAAHDCKRERLHAFALVNPPSLAHCRRFASLVNQGAVVPTLHTEFRPSDFISRAEPDQHGRQTVRSFVTRSS
eukprot:3180317-Amphidinium_carterae.1